jgi:protein tyrosine phosphatase (PTP) superfamily phosphohydrolase (DUF442 family)
MLILLAVGVAWAGVYYGHWVLVRRRFVTVASGWLYQSAAMRPPRLVRCVRRHGITAVIDFRGPSEVPEVQAEARALAAAGIQHINIPCTANPSAEAISRFVEVMRQKRSAGRGVLLHCKDGEGRAIAFAAIYRIEFEGWSTQQAYRAASRLPPGFRFVSKLFPGAGLLSRRNLKTPLILNYRPTLSVAERAAQHPPAAATGLEGATPVAVDPHDFI